MPESCRLGASRVLPTSQAEPAIKLLIATCDVPHFHGCICCFRYSEGQRFGKHVDGRNDLPGGRVTGYTLLIYLNGRGESKGKTRGFSKNGGPAGPDFIGGETVFYDESGAVLRSVAPAAGMALLHLHGEACYEHEGAAVKTGTKYVLRSDVVFG